jgi:fermentation-respiration switch protein FrsA (DUF1100 family)
VGQTLLTSHWWTWPLGFFPYLTVSEKYSAKDIISDISPTPLLVIHGDADPVVRFSNGEEVYAAAKEPKEFWKVPGGLHIQAFSGPHSEEFQKRFLEKLEQNCSKK